MYRPPAMLAVLLLIVELVRIKEPSSSMPPPKYVEPLVGVELLSNVELLTVSVLPNSRYNPAPLSAVFPLNVDEVNVAVPPAMKAPPPSTLKAPFLLIVV